FCHRLPFGLMMHAQEEFMASSSSTNRKSSTISARYEKIYKTVAQIPPGHVSTYGQVAAVAGFPGAARQVGYALHALPFGSPIPWHRVINAQGKLSLDPRSESGKRQLRLLRAEGI